MDPEKAKAESEAKAWAEFSEFAGGVARDELCGKQPMGWLILRIIAETFVNLHAIDLPQLFG